MKFKNTILTVFIVALLAGCETSARLNDVRIGMTKDQVVALLGAPDSTSAQANVEYLTYYLDNDSGYGRDRPYMVRMVDGKVESFGRFTQLWDLQNRPIGNTQIPAMSGTPPAPDATDLATQLEKLKALKDQGVLTDDEFQKAKAKLLAPQQ